MVYEIVFSILNHWFARQLEVTQSHLALTIGTSFANLYKGWGRGRDQTTSLLVYMLPLILKTYELINISEFLLLSFGQWWCWTLYCLKFIKSLMRNDFVDSLKDVHKRSLLLQIRDDGLLFAAICSFHTHDKILSISELFPSVHGLSHPNWAIQPTNMNKWELTCELKLMRHYGERLSKC